MRSYRTSCVFIVEPQIDYKAIFQEAMKQLKVKKSLNKILRTMKGKIFAHETSTGSEKYLFPQKLCDILQNYLIFFDPPFFSLFAVINEWLLMQIFGFFYKVYQIFWEGNLNVFSEAEYFWSVNLLIFLFIFKY